MRESLQILLIAGSLISGILVIFLTHKLLRKYRLPYLSSYFFYLIFLFVFGIYGLIGPTLIRVYLESRNVDIETIESSSLFFSYIGFPFLILSWYMFIRLSEELVNRKISTGFNISFLFLAIAYIAFGIILVERKALGLDQYEIIRKSMLIAFSVISLVVYGYALTRLLLESVNPLDKQDRMSIRLFGYFYILFAAGTIVLINLAGRSRLYGYGFVILFFSIHLLPVFFQTLHLDRNFVEAVRSTDFKDCLEQFIRHYEISKRETEVIRLICEGKSNLDISDSLFISLQTVKDHIHHVYLKTGVKNRVQLTNLIRDFS